MCIKIHSTGWPISGHNSWPRRRLQIGPHTLQKIIFRCFLTRQETSLDFTSVIEFLPISMIILTAFSHLLNSDSVQVSGPGRMSMDETNHALHSSAYLLWDPSRLGTCLHPRCSTMKLQSPAQQNPGIGSGNRVRHISDIIMIQRTLDCSALSSGVGMMGKDSKAIGD
jgi:hypothetical protein